MIKITIYISALFFMISSCDTKGETSVDSGEIEIGKYRFKFPKGFELIPEQGIDSSVGRISDGKIEFLFDYGYYSNSLDKSIDEYLTQEFWKINALGANNLLAEGDITGITKEVELLSYSTLDSIQYELLFHYKSDTITYNLKVPETVRNVNIKIDTVDYVRYKFVQSEGRVGMYAKDLKSFNSSINSYKALSIIANDLSPEQVEECLEILRSCRSSTP